MTVKKISPAELDARLKNEKLVMLDVRAEEKYRDYHIEDENIKPFNINKNKIFGLEGEESASLDSLPKDQEIIVTCTTGNSAAKCANILAEKDYNVAVLEGGVTAWKEYLKTKG